MRRRILFSAVMIGLAALAVLYTLSVVANRYVVGRVVATSGLIVLCTTGALAARRAGWKRAAIGENPGDERPARRVLTPYKVVSLLGVGLFLSGVAYGAVTKGSKADEAACDRAYRFWAVDKTLGYPGPVFDLLGKADDETLRLAGQKMATAEVAQFAEAYLSLWSRCKQLGFLPASVQVARDPGPVASPIPTPIIDTTQINAFVRRIARAAHLGYVAGKTKNFEESVATQSLMVTDLKAVARDLGSAFLGVPKQVIDDLVAELDSSAAAMKALVDCRRRSDARTSCRVLGDEFDRRWKPMIIALRALNSYGTIPEATLDRLIVKD